MSGAADLARIRILGGGPVALACALWLARSGIDVQRIRLTAARPASAPSGPAPSGPPRRIALSGGSCQLLGRIAQVPAGGEIARIEVAQAGASGRTRIQARDFAVPSLGRVVSWNDLVASLREAAGHRGLLPSTGSDSDDGPAVTIHAEGQPPGSPDDDGFSRRDFDQTALLTEIEADCHGEPTDSRGQVAYECFGQDGPLALLPITPAARTGTRMRYAIVWCDREASSRRRAHLSAERLATELEAAFAGIVRSPSRPAGFSCIAAASTAPLVRLRRRRVVAGLDVWIGNAAQALHPVAGQGLNLGLRDAFELARLLGDADRDGGDRSLSRQLADYARGRSTDRTLTTGLTDLMAMSFRWPAARPLQSLMLTALDLSPMLRRPLASTLLYGTR